MDEIFEFVSVSRKNLNFSVFCFEVICRTSLRVLILFFILLKRRSWKH